MTAAIEPETAEAFTRKLELFEQHLSLRDRAILLSLLQAAMDPWARAAARPISDVLDPEEAALLAELCAETPNQR